MPRPSVGSLVRARGREWVVLPESEADPDLLVLRPLAGTDDEVAGVYLPLEPVEPAHFGLPDPARGLGNHRSGRLLRDAVRLGFRSGAGPFRSLGAIAVEPRPYQLVPLLMALRLDPVRLLIADDVGVGKTVEALLVARELLDRGEVRRTAVLCPPHLADQWQRALAEQFEIDAQVVLPGTAARLEREAGVGPSRSLFDHYPHVVVSLDYVKSERRRHEFIRACPELVIVDEAHTCASVGLGRAAQQRHALLQDLAKDDGRHLILVTATPHSGNEDAYRSLLSLLEPAFRELPLDLSGEDRRKDRERLARHVVQRRRGDIRRYLDSETPFPGREMGEDHYLLTPAYRRFFDRVLDWAKETVSDESGGEHRRRVRWWSALALLRSVSSSPAAAAATLRARAANLETATPEEADDVGRRAVLDQDDETQEGIDVIPGARTEPDAAEGEGGAEARKLSALAREADKLAGPTHDAKLKRATGLVQELLKEGHAPILFCRFIPTVEYVVEALRKALPKDVTVEGVTGTLAHDERERRVEALGAHPRRVLVATDCLSEGINLQHHFDAVMHYDLSWNPTRHEQREGRVDRYGQERPTVRTLTFYGQDNPVDGIVLDVLLRKHKAIHKALGISVPVPMDTGAVVEAVFEGLMLRGRAATQMALGFVEPQRKAVDVQWDAAADREKKSRTVFAQHGLDVAEVARELEAARAAVGDTRLVEAFVTESLKGYGAAVARKKRHTDLDLTGAPVALREALGVDTLRAGFDPADPAGAEVLTRTHPFVAALAGRVFTAALDEVTGGPARRCAAIRTRAVRARTTLLLLRLRFHLVVIGRDDKERPLLAEDVALAGFTGSPDSALWLSPEAVEPLLAAEPDENVGPDVARTMLGRVVEGHAALAPHLEALARDRAEALLDAHKRVRKAARARVRTLRVEPHLPVDVLGLFVLLPVAGGAP